MNHTQSLLLAYAISTYQTTLESFDALREAGVDVPWAVSGRVEIEQRRMVRRWMLEQGSAVEGDTDHVLPEVRAWLTEHVVELDALLEEKGIR